ncbi:MAG TPA: sulfatase [Thermoanaerobaculia bacterium]|nr:sulfatase [Thermoanaerobaculia bacterium]
MRALFLALLLQACQPAQPPAPAVALLPARSNLLLITVDTLRADHLSSYGYPRRTSPVIDRLAAEGVRFDQPAAQWPKTTPSFASMFTATYPKDNGNVRKIGTPLPCRARTLAEEIRAAGYTTHAVVANGAVGSELRFDQGFDTYVETWKLPPGKPGEDLQRAERATALALASLDAAPRDRPWFLWVHYLDPHWPYTPPGEHRDRFQGDERFDPSGRIPVVAGKERQEMRGIGEGQVEDARDELAFYVARYDAEIAYTDAWIGRLLDGLRSRGRLDRTLTAVTADHGESLGDHQYYFDHGRFGFQSCLRVPLILHYPGVLAPRVDRGPVELIHLAPTLLEAAGVPLRDGVWMQGRSLTPRLRGAAQGGSLAFSEAGYETKGRWQKVVRDGRFKLVFAQTRPDQRWIGGEGVRFTLYDLARDPGETENVAGRFSQEAERLTRALWRWDRAPRFAVETEPPEADCAGDRPLAAETEKLLHSLGYL